MSGVVIIEYGPPLYRVDCEVLKEAVLCALDNAESSEEFLPFVFMAYEGIVALIAESN